MKPELTASVTFLQPPAARADAKAGGVVPPAAPIVVVSKRAIVQRGDAGVVTGPVEYFDGPIKAGGLQALPQGIINS